MADVDHQELRGAAQPGNGYSLSGKIMLSAIVILFAVVVFMVGFHLYARWYIVRLRRRQIERRRVQRRVSRSEIIMYIDSRLPAAVEDHGLDRAVLNSLPVFLYSHKAEEEQPQLECAVCLSEFEEKEIVRVLPKCGHSFHIECIDMWFSSHSTCPLCRSPVEQVLNRPPEPEVTANVPDPGSSSVSETVGVDGNTNTSSFGWRGKGLGPAGVRIEVPARGCELDNELTQSSPAAASRLLSLKRILSMGRRSPATTPSGAGTSHGANELDLESGLSESSRGPSRI